MQSIFDACKNASIISAKEAESMKSLLPLMPLIHLRVKCNSSSIPFNRQDLTPKEGHSFDIAIDTVSNRADDYITIFKKLFQKLHVQDELFQVFELYIVLFAFSQKFQLALRNVIASEFASMQYDKKAGNEPNSMKEIRPEMIHALLRHVEKSSLLPFAFYHLPIVFKYTREIVEYIPEEPLREYISAISSFLSRREAHSDPDSPTIVIVHALMEILKYPPAREIFHEARGFSGLMYLLQPPYMDIQLTYEVCFSLWVLSFNDKIVQYFKHDNIIPKLHDVLRLLKVEKVVRIIVSTFKNLIAHPGFVSSMISVSVPKTLALLKKRHFEDEDIAEIINDISESITVKMDELSSFDEYRQEVLSGNLQWTPVHTSQKFWKENVKKLQEDDFRMVKTLAKLLENPDTENPNNLAISCHDLGMFIQFHPRGKRTITDLGAKNYIISLCEHPNQEVKKQALSTTQKLLLSSASWF